MNVWGEYGGRSSIVMEMCAQSLREVLASCRTAFMCVK